MENINWTADMESCLFYAMMDHKPVGENKHFNMIFIYEKYNNLCEKKLNAEQIWSHLNVLYDLQALVSVFSMFPFYFLNSMFLLERYRSCTFS
jgi:MRG-binding protein